jgi:hypothetical protein
MEGLTDPLEEEMVGDPLLDGVSVPTMEGSSDPLLDDEADLALTGGLGSATGQQPERQQLE